jgi:anthranilate phosphoribosyltransferase
MAISTVNGGSPLEAFQLAKESLLSGKGLASLNKLQELSK